MKNGIVTGEKSTRGGKQNIEGIGEVIRRILKTFH